MIAYDEFSTFRTPAPRKAVRSAPERIEALDDLHRALYGSLHPAAAIVESDHELVEGDGESSRDGASWLENHALTAAIGLVSVFALYTWMKSRKEDPLRGPPATPAVPFTAAPSPTPTSTP